MVVEMGGERGIQRGCHPQFPFYPRPRRWVPARGTAHGMTAIALALPNHDGSVALAVLKVRFAV
jgi:hypothetical protein